MWPRPSFDILRLLHDHRTLPPPVRAKALIALVLPNSNPDLEFAEMLRTLLVLGFTKVLRAYGAFNDYSRSQLNAKDTQGGMQSPSAVAGYAERRHPDSLSNRQARPVS
jgi:hypothetical protein